MKRIFGLLPAFYATGALVVACGGSDFTTAAQSDASADGLLLDSYSPESSMSEASGPGGDSGTGVETGQAESGGGMSTDSGTEAGPSPCPAVGGGYKLAIGTSGTACPTVNTSATQCVVQSTCSLQFISKVSLDGGAGTAINGTAVLQTDGTFSGAMLVEGTGPRSGCVGSWSANSSTLTVNCGGTGSTQSCTLVLTRVGPTCG
jgi:hypothetical protein